MTDKTGWRHRKRPADVRPGCHAARARSSLCRPRSAGNPAFEAMRCSWTSSSCDSGREMVCSCSPCNCMDSPSESMQCQRYATTPVQSKISFSLLLISGYLTLILARIFSSCSRVISFLGNFLLKICSTGIKAFASSNLKSFAENAEPIL